MTISILSKNYLVILGDDIVSACMSEEMALNVAKATGAAAFRNESIDGTKITISLIRDFSGRVR